MPNKILKKSSFGLLRTNPKLTTNIKIIADSKNRIYLETIDANPLLSKSIYKGFEVSGNGSYSFDLRRFFSQGSRTLPEDIAYSIFEEDPSISVKDKFHEQYDFTYGYGMYPKNSRLYSEEFSLFAPLWVEKDSIPDYFLVFKMDDPVTFNTNTSQWSTTNLDSSTILNSLVEDPSNFFDNVLKKSKIIKKFDLTDKTEIGKYIRNHINDPSFPESPFYASLNKNENSYWNGITYRKGGFGSIGTDIYLDYTLIDKTFIESEDFITDGFKRNSVVCANLLNMEFLFDDEEQIEYTFGRYFGLYVSEVELGKFEISNERLFDDRFNELTQIPQSNKPVIGVPTSTKGDIQYNVNGIKIYPQIGASGPYSGRLMTWSEIQNVRFGYVKDRNDNFYSIDNVTNWSTLDPPTNTTDTDYLRIKNKTIDWKNFTGFEDPFTYIPSKKTEIAGRPAIAFKLISALNDGDEIRVQYTDWTNPLESPYVDNHTVKGSSTLPSGTISGLTFSTNGTLKDVSIAIVASINQIQNYSNEIQAFHSFYINGEILIFSRINSENWNKLKISLFSDSSIFPFLLSNEFIDEQSTTTYQSSPITLSPISAGKLLVANFEGGNSQPESRAIIERKYIQEFIDPIDDIFIKTNSGYNTTDDYGLYLDEPIYNDSGEIIGFNDYDKYYVVNLLDNKQKIEFGSSSKLALYKKAKNTNGYLSIFPIKDFDFDFNNTDYKKDADSSPLGLYDWYIGGTGGTGNIPIFNYPAFGSTSQSFIYQLIGPTSPFVQNGGFQSLIGYQDDLNDTVDPVTNEYDRLKENYVTQLALSSRVVPFINKWVYDNESTDVRENGYRLNVDQSMGYNNFSPDFDQVEKTPKFFTHEWYYLQKYPPYMDFDQKLNTFSYFDEDLYFPSLPIIGSPGSTSTYLGLTGASGASANLLSIEEDYFLSYFTRETIDGLEIPRDFKYSLFSGSSNSKAAETLFRGVKVEILDRSEFSSINYNRDSLKYVYNEKYNNYKFSAILTYGNAGSQITVIKNDKWKSITLVIQSDFSDVLFQYEDTTTSTINKFIDRALLYTVDDRLKINAGELEYKDNPISGKIINWIDSGSYFEVIMGMDNVGNTPNLINEIIQNENGGYNSISVSANSLTYTFNDIFDITANSFKCSSISGLPLLTSPLIPNGSYSLNVLTIGIAPNSPTWSPFVTLRSSPLETNPIYDNGGYNAYRSLIDSISFSNIQSLINLGDNEIRYISVSNSGVIEENTYVINLVRPDYPIKSSYLKREALKKTSIDSQQTESILGYTIGALDRMSLSPLVRYRGNYTPRWKDVFRFVDLNDLKTEGLDYLNIQILTDLGWIKDDNFGMIKNLYFNKVNTENPNIIISNNLNTNSERFIYPLIGDVSIDYSDFYVFRSSWDPFYYKKYIKNNLYENVIGTRDPKEEKSFFASKTISIPNEIRLETFPLGVSTSQDVIDAGSLQNIDAGIITKAITTSTKTELDLSILVTKSLSDWLITDGFGTEFYKFINPNYSFGDLIIEDDIKTYIQENILQRYVIKEVILWEKVWIRSKGVINPPQIAINLTDAEKIKNNYLRSKNFKVIIDEGGGLNFKVIYTVPKDKRTSIAITVVLEKK
jgi:hypothetical protein